MRSSPLLLLLVTTQWCFFVSSTASDVDEEMHSTHNYNCPSFDSNANDEKVRDRRSIPQKINVTYPTEKEVKGYSKDGLKKKRNEKENEWEDAKTALSEAKKDLKEKQNELTNAENNYLELDRKWNDAKKELDEKQEPRKQIYEEVARKMQNLSESSNLLRNAEEDANFPLDSQDKKKYSIESTRGIKKLKEVELPKLKNETTEAFNKKNRMMQSYKTALEKSMMKNCPEKIDETMRGRNDPCIPFIQDIEAFKVAETEYISATKKSQTAESELKKEEKLVAYLDALTSFEVSEADYKEAQNRSDNVPNDVKIAIGNEYDAQKSVNTAKELNAKLTKDKADLQEKVAAAQTKEEASYCLHQFWAHAYSQRPDETTSQIVSSSSTPIIVICVAVVLLLLAVSVALILCCKKRNKKNVEISKTKKKKKSTSDESKSAESTASSTNLSTESNGKKKEKQRKIRRRVKSANDDEKGDARVANAKLSEMWITPGNYHLSTVTLMGSFLNDLPHDRADEKTDNVPRSYAFGRNKLEFFAYGSEENKPEINPPPITDFNNNFFQSKIFNSVSTTELIKYFKSQNRLPAPLEVASQISKAGGNTAVVTIDASSYRTECLQYVDAMATKSYAQNTTEERFQFQFFHVMWTLVNVKNVLGEQKCHLLRFNGSIVVAGDTRGKFDGLLRTFAQRATPEKPGWLTHNYIFLGNYVDKEMFSLEVVMFLFLLKILYPKHIFLLRGNHETSEMNSSYLRDECIARFDKEMGEEIFRRLNEVFSYLPLTALINNSIFCVHGGLSRELNPEGMKNGNDPKETKEEKKKRIEENLRKLGEIFDPKNLPMPLESISDLTRGLLWNRPSNIQESDKDPCYCSADVARFRNNYKFDLIFHGSEVMANGHKFYFGPSDIGVFTAPNYMGLNNRSSTFAIELDDRIHNHLAGYVPRGTSAQESLDIFCKCQTNGTSMDDKEIPVEKTKKP